MKDISFNERKKDSLGGRPFLEKVFLLMGYSKNYIMYWGVTHIILASTYRFDYPHNSQISQNLSWIFVEF